MRTPAEASALPLFGFDQGLVLRSGATLLLATIAAGGGHVASARAMAQALERLYPAQVEVRISDFMQEVGATSFDQRHKAMWRWALRYPQSARLGQRQAACHQAVVRHDQVGRSGRQMPCGEPREGFQELALDAHREVR